MHITKDFWGITVLFKDPQIPSKASDAQGWPKLSLPLYSEEEQNWYLHQSCLLLFFML